MSKEKTSFVFYKDWYLAGVSCDDKTQLSLYRAIFEYAFLDLIPSDPALQLVFPMIRRKIDEDRGKYDSKCERYRQIAIERERKKREERQTTIVHDSEQTYTNSTYNDNDSDNVNEPTNVGIKEKTSKEVKKTAADAATHAQELMEVRKQKFYNSLIPFVEVYGKKMIRDFYDYWTEPNKSGTQFKQELERTWSLERRLRTWAERETVQPSDKRSKPNGVPKPFIMEGVQTQAERDAEKQAKWEKERNRLVGLLQSARDNPQGSAAKMIETYRKNGTLQKYQLE